LVGGVLVSLICIRQTDLKSLIAYSSVAHIGVVIGGIITINYLGVCGSFTKPVHKRQTDPLVREDVNIRTMTAKV
jgi:NADH:ubiquinone oxidoreductase subunit 4 (subunit M)